MLGLYGALLHTLNHAIAKAVLFLGSGDVSMRYRTREAAKVRGLLTAVSVTGGARLLGSVAVLGSPPFGLFLSEVTIVRAGFAGASPAMLLLALLAVAFIAFARTTAGMMTGEARAPPTAYTGRAARWAAALPLVAGLAALRVLGWWIPAGLNTAGVSLDELLPEWHFRERHRHITNAPAPALLTAVEQVTWAEVPVMAVLMGIRSGGQLRLAARHCIIGDMAAADFTVLDRTSEELVVAAAGAAMRSRRMRVGAPCRGQCCMPTGAGLGLSSAFCTLAGGVPPARVLLRRRSQGLVQRDR